MEAAEGFGCDGAAGTQGVVPACTLNFEPFQTCCLDRVVLQPSFSGVNETFFLLRTSSFPSHSAECALQIDWIALIYLLTLVCSEAVPLVPVAQAPTLTQGGTKKTHGIYL